MGLEARGGWDKYRKALSRRKSALGPPPSRPQLPRVRSDQRALGGTRGTQHPKGLSVAKFNMKILVALAVFFLVSTQLFAEEIGANDDLNYWSDWSDSDQIKEELPEPFEHLLQRIARRPKPQQFFGLMGKRDAGHGQISHKRHKTDSFVGLMGKRALNSVAYERSAMQNYERRR
ncbi:protachykinin-1 isoform X2 [Trachypithecus francoisi]|uniref:protachykinin-1 isoform X2 n=1 Tax=Trachypithecus francoisi TaxID=54180 RepID=UPI00141AD612|nr:protachykinin-1 isoform X2 [Trachypithecus francoisi]